MAVAWSTVALVAAVIVPAPLPTEASAAARFSAVSLRLYDLVPLLVKPSMMVAWATVALVVAVIVPAALATPVAAAARFSAVSLRL